MRKKLFQRNVFDVGVIRYSVANFIPRCSVVLSLTSASSSCIYQILIAFLHIHWTNEVIVPESQLQSPMMQKD